MSYTLLSPQLVIYALCVRYCVKPDRTRAEMSTPPYKSAHDVCDQLYPLPMRDANYCDEYICLSVRLHNLKTTGPNFTKCFLHGALLPIAMARSVLLWRSCNKLCTSSIVDDVIFWHNGSTKGYLYF